MTEKFETLEVEKLDVGEILPIEAMQGLYSIGIACIFTDGKYVQMVNERQEILNAE